MSIYVLFSDDFTGAGGNPTRVRLFGPFPTVGCATAYMSDPDINPADVPTWQVVDLSPDYVVEPETPPSVAVY